MLAAFAGGLAEGASLGQRGVELADVLGGGDDKDAVSHPEHGGDAVVNDGLGERADGPDFVVDALECGVRSAECGIGLIGGGLLLLSTGGFVHGGLAGVEHQHRHAVVVKQLAEFAARHGPHLAVAGVFEQQVAVFASGLAAQRESVDGFQPVGQGGLAQVLVAAVAVEVDDVVGPSGGFGVG